MTQVTDDIYALIAEIKVDLATKATTQKIDELLVAINKKDVKIQQLEENVKSLNKKVDLLTQKVDDVEARSRRGNLRIRGIPLPQNFETGDQCLAKVKEVFEQLPAGIDECSYSRAHRVGKVKQ